MQRMHTLNGDLKMSQIRWGVKWVQPLPLMSTILVTHIPLMGTNSEEKIPYHGNICILSCIWSVPQVHCSFSARHHYA